MVSRPGLWNKASLHQPRHRMMFQAAGPWTCWCWKDRSAMTVATIRRMWWSEFVCEKGRWGRNWWFEEVQTLVCDKTFLGDGVLPNHRRRCWDCHWYLAFQKTKPWRQGNLHMDHMDSMDCINLSFGLRYSPTPISTSPMNCTKTYTGCNWVCLYAGSRDVAWRANEKNQQPVTNQGTNAAVVTPRYLTQSFLPHPSDPTWLSDRTEAKKLAHLLLSKSYEVWTCRPMSSAQNAFVLKLKLKLKTTTTTTRTRTTTTTRTRTTTTTAAAAAAATATATAATTTTTAATTTTTTASLSSESSSAVPSNREKFNKKNQRSQGLDMATAGWWARTERQHVETWPWAQCITCTTRCVPGDAAPKIEKFPTWQFQWGFKQGNHEHPLDFWSSLFMLISFYVHTDPYWCHAHISMPVPRPRTRTSSHARILRGRELLTSRFQRFHQHKNSLGNHKLIIIA